MAKARKTWREKLDDSKDLPKTVQITGAMRRNWGEGSCLIPAPKDVDAVMRKVPAKRVATVNELRGALANAAGATMACPLTTGIFAWIAANAAYEAEEAGKTRVTPWWRTLKAKGELNPKFPGGVAEQMVRLEAEGHRVVTKGKRVFVEGYEQRLWRGQ